MQHDSAHHDTPTPCSSSSGGVSKVRIVKAGNYLYEGARIDQASYRIGREGEERIVDKLEAAFDGNWTLFRNVTLPGRRGDIDIVLVGPSGIWVIEVKTYSGFHQVMRGRWYKGATEGSMIRIRRGPNWQARHNASTLSRYLKKEGIRKGTWVEPVVVMAKEASLDIASSGTQIWRWSDLDTHLQTLRSKEPEAGSNYARVVNVLEHISTTSRRLSAPVLPGTRVPTRTSPPIVPAQAAMVKKVSSHSTPSTTNTFTPYPSRQRPAPRREVGRQRVGYALIGVGMWALLVAAALYALSNGLGSGQWIALPRTAPLSAAPTSAVNAPTHNTADLPSGGSPSVTALRPVRVSASGNAPPSQDSKHNPVTFVASNVADGDDGTAWRVPGSGVGQFLQLDFAGPVRITEVGLVPGYKKIDPADGTDRFAQNRRISRARFEFSDGSAVEADFADAPTLQVHPVTQIESRYVRVIILKTTQPGSNSGRDFAAISEVVVRGSEQSP